MATVLTMSCTWSWMTMWVATLPVLSPAASHAVGLDLVHRELVQFADWEGLVRELAELHRDGIPSDEEFASAATGAAAGTEAAKVAAAGAATGAGLA